MNREETLERFKKTLKIRHYEERTQTIYLIWIERFFDYINFTDSEQITQFDGQEYLLYLLDEENYAPRTHNQAVYALRQFYEAVRGIATTQRQLPKIRPEITQKRWFTGEQARQLVNNCRDLQLKAAIALSFGCGLRISEITNLRFENIHKVSGTLTVVTSKGNVTRTIPYSSTVASILNHYCYAAAISRNPEDYIFQDKEKPGQRLKNSALTQKFSKFIQDFEFALPEHSFHSLRHSFATEQSMRGVPLPYIQALIGHKSAATTANYIHVPQTMPETILDNLSVQEENEDYHHEQSNIQ